MDTLVSILLVCLIGGLLAESMERLTRKLFSPNHCQELRHGCSYERGFHCGWDRGFDLAMHRYRGQENGPIRVRFDIDRSRAAEGKPDIRSSEQERAHRAREAAAPLGYDCVRCGGATMNDDSAVLPGGRYVCTSCVQGLLDLELKTADASLHGLQKPPSIQEREKAS
ncbi:MAG TPA: hypothetical protein VEZ90_17675 [Blastocatellia bacterium]|nr:hypothetical protein [Blastocatellia bacterium]